MTLTRFGVAIASQILVGLAGVLVYDTTSEIVNDSSHGKWWQCCCTAFVVYTSIQSCNGTYKKDPWYSLHYHLNIILPKKDLELFTTLPDIGFDFFDWIGIQDSYAFSLGTHLPDYMVFGLNYFTIARFILTPLGATIQRRWSFNLGTLFFFRGISIVATMLPNPMQHCTTKALDYDVWEGAWRILAGELVTCADVLFSGHTVNACLVGLIWHTYSHKVGVRLFRAKCDPIGAVCCLGRPVTNEVGRLVRATTEKYLMWIWVIVTFFVIIATRFHYTIDVIIGLWMCVLLWKLYHYYLYSLYMNRENYFDIAMQWFEKDSEEFNVEQEIARQAIGSIRRRSMHGVQEIRSRTEEGEPV